jgi:anti-sigma B factor antagonist
MSECFSLSEVSEGSEPLEVAPFEAMIVHNDGVTVVVLVGELDMATAPRLRDVLQTVDGPVVLDCARLTFLDSSGLGVLAERRRATGTVTLRNVQPICRRVLSITGMDTIVAVEGT